MVQVGLAGAPLHPLPAAVAGLFEALARHGRALARGDDDLLRLTSVEVGGHVAHVVDLASPGEGGRLDGPPPEPVAVAMARALFSAPHLSQTLSVYTTASDTLVFQPDLPLAQALGLPLERLEELRDEVDLGVSRVLKQGRALHWLWHRAGNPRVTPGPLMELLFPGVHQPTADHFAWRGSRLYAVFPQTEPPPPEALYLQWLPGAARWTCVPDTHFAARYLDPGTVLALTRAIGATDAEVRAMLDEMVCAVPLDQEHAFVHHDRWRSEGWAALTGLGTAQPGGAWLTLPLAPDAVGPDDWLEATPEGLALRAPRRVFDRHATTRITAMVHGLYAEMCARLLTGRTIEPAQQPALFDLDPYLQRVLQPLLDWTASPRAHASLAAAVGAGTDHVAVAMGQVRTAWLDAARQSWGGAPQEARPWTVQAVLAIHLALVQGSLHRAFRREADPRAAHHRILLLFFAHHVAKAPLARLWKPVDGRLPPPEDVVGTWFWGTWLRVLDALDADAA